MSLMTGHFDWKKNPPLCGCGGKKPPWSRSLSTRSTCSRSLVKKTDSEFSIPSSGAAVTPAITKLLPSLYSWLNSCVFPVVRLTFITTWLGALHLSGTRRDLWSVIQQSDQNTWWNFINLYQSINLKSQILDFHGIWGIWKLSMWRKFCFSPLHSRNVNVEDITTSTSVDISTLRLQMK